MYRQIGSATPQAPQPSRHPSRDAAIQILAIRATCCRPPLSIGTLNTVVIAQVGYLLLILLYLLPPGLLWYICGRENRPDYSRYHRMTKCVRVASTPARIPQTLRDTVDSKRHPRRSFVGYISYYRCLTAPTEDVLLAGWQRHTGHIPGSSRWALVTRKIRSWDFQAGVVAVYTAGQTQRHPPFWQSDS